MKKKPQAKGAKRAKKKKADARAVRKHKLGHKAKAAHRRAAAKARKPKTSVTIEPACPRCEMGPLGSFPALSRYVHGVSICSWCGAAEARNDGGKPHASIRWRERLPYGFDTDTDDWRDR